MSIEALCFRLADLRSRQARLLRGMYHRESRWRNFHTLVYHGPLLSHLLGVGPSTFTKVYAFMHLCTSDPIHQFIPNPKIYQHPTRIAKAQPLLVHCCQTWVMPTVKVSEVCLQCIIIILVSLRHFPSCAFDFLKLLQVKVT